MGAFGSALPKSTGSSFAMTVSVLEGMNDGSFDEFISALYGNVPISSIRKALKSLGIEVSETTISRWRKEGVYRGSVRV